MSVYRDPRHFRSGRLVPESLSSCRWSKQWRSQLKLQRPDVATNFLVSLPNALDPTQLNDAASSLNLDGYPTLGGVSVNGYCDRDGSAGRIHGHHKIYLIDADLTWGSTGPGNRRAPAANRGRDWQCQS
jgi:hypothetical protein